MGGGDISLGGVFDFGPYLVHGQPGRGGILGEGGG